MAEFQYAIIIPAWNEAAFIESSIQSVQSAMSSVPFTGQLIVVDNNSTDQTAQLATNAGAQVVFEPVNQIARARNAGAKAANAEMFVFVDADTHISSELLLSALEALHSNKVVGGGASICGDRPAGFVTQSGINVWNWVSRLFKLAAGCFVYTRADAFFAVDGFALHRYAGEELVLSQNLRRWGKKNNMQFQIITQYPVETSLRKIDWYSPAQLAKQTFMALLPGALRSKSRMSTWYDESIDRTQNVTQNLTQNLTQSNNLNQSNRSVAMSKEIPFNGEQMQGCEFSKADMSNAKFNGVQLTGAQFWAVLENASFTDSNLASVKFDDVNLGNANFNNVNLSSAQYTNINLSGASFKDVNMQNVSIDQANLDGMRINGVLVSELIDSYNQK